MSVYVYEKYFQHSLNITNAIEDAFITLIENQWETNLSLRHAYAFGAVRTPILMIMGDGYKCQYCPQTRVMCVTNKDGSFVWHKVLLIVHQKSNSMGAAPPAAETSSSSKMCLGYTS